ncbi:putative sporulation protein YyaC [Ruminiclostridium sufflavum DSM 19573]|uniref:Putative sporulation protein YyaC n=1 Tax=Ruminiclostridium sufflavum DSM 19573 TaxID=1121337 RepID=A0A318XMQ1_9FIRM|nr:spore protease YyaC [Ruminiclostridium sufflavum]PYG87202.1 putative sporulation protein YyaC [Ruminiclostridium sufflavum DSM 19573]
MSFEEKASNLTYIDAMSVNAFALFSEALYKTITFCRTEKYSDIVFVCIGSDRSTGDSLGPIIGHKLREMKYCNVHVFGNLENPVHAKNLCETTNYILERFEMPFIIAIDASLGKMEHVGHITVGKGALKPGSAVNKDLQPIGNMHITGIVNFSGFMDFLTLQNTRLGTVMKIADIISSGIRYTIWRIQRDDIKRSISSVESI